MKVIFIEKKYKAAQRFKNVVGDKLARLDKYFQEEPTATVCVSKQDKREKLEISITGKGILFRAEVSGNNNYENIDLALPKIEKQIVRSKQKAKSDRRSKKVEYAFLEEEPDVKLAEIVKQKTFDLDPISVEDAKDALERTDHAFYIFLNAETGKVNVLYKRNDKKYGLIEVKF
jgi:putative sigma-54 modulation protein